MLSSLHIKNFAIIEEESVTFTEGFSALTGETGAGKSILLDALSLLLGERASVEMIRRGAPRATIEGRFHFASPWVERVKGRLEALQLPPTDQEISLQIKRNINRSSANKLWINGAPARLTALRQLTEGLLEIVRQHESHQLLEPESHLGLLDRFAGLAEEAAQLSETVDRWKRLESEARRLTEQQAQDQARLERLEAQISRLERIAPEPGEDERVAQQLGLLQAAEGLSTWVDGGLHELYARDGAILESIERLQQQLSTFIHVDPRLDAFHQALDRAHLELDELHHDLRRFRGEIPSDPDQIRELESRRDQLEALKDEFDATLEEIIEELDQSRAERDSLHAAGSQIKKLERDAAAHHRRAGVIARGLAAARRSAGEKLSERVEVELQGLGMSRCRFRVDFTPNERLNRRGLDRVEFLISPNPGEGFKGLARIASGGELSRLTLALKVILMSSDETPTYLFDEIDTGIGGAVAEGVGWKLKRIATQRQVLCITHLPQVAACAAEHLLIAKAHESNRTFSTIRALHDDVRVYEMARMLGGKDLTEATLRHAQEMIERGQEKA